jgi:hypothetical protein
MEVSPSVHERIVAALRIATALESKIDKDTTKAVKLHLLKCFHSSKLSLGTSDEILILALEAFQASQSITPLLRSLEMFMREAATVNTIDMYLSTASYINLILHWHAFLQFIDVIGPIFGGSGLSSSLPPIIDITPE